MTTRESRTARHEAVKTVIFNAWTKGRIKFYSNDDGSEEDFLADEILDVLDEAQAAPDAALRIAETIRESALAYKAERDALREALDEAERLLAEAAPRMVVGDRRASEWYVLLREWQASLAALPTSPPALRRCDIGASHLQRGSATWSKRGNTDNVAHSRRLRSCGCAEPSTPASRSSPANMSGTTTT